MKHSSLPEGIQVAVGAAARSLPADDPRAHVFVEDRVDLRVALSSHGSRDRALTRARGGTIAGRRSVHDTDPTFLAELPDRQPPDLPWVPGLEERVLDAADKATRGRPRTRWRASLVSFRQDVWVGRFDGSVQAETRLGSRLELRVTKTEPGSGSAVADMILHPNNPEGLHRRFEAALDRVEERSGGLGGVKAGECAAVFAPGVAGVVAHELIGHALEGDVVVRMGSWLHGMADLQSQAEVTVIDDPRRGRGAWRVDDEGSQSASTVLIERNRVVGALHDRSSAQQLRATPTGHGRRASYLDAVLPRMGCTYIDAGVDDPADILRSTESGVFIRRLVAGHTDPTSGRSFFTVTDADRIVAGRCAGPIDTFVLEIDARVACRAIDRVAHDLAFDSCIGSCVRDGQPLAVSVGAPTIRIGVVTVRSC